MRKKLPNILLAIVVLVNIFFMGTYIRNNSLGLFLSTTGIVLLILGVIIFIFFLSIDPGYGWTKSIDLTKNYIMIFTSMAVSIVGVVLIITGQHMNELHVLSISEKERCQDIMGGKIAEVMKRDWYTLRDRLSQDKLDLYLFQKKSDRNNYKIIATIRDANISQTINNMAITSDSIPNTLYAVANNSKCPGVLEKNISIDFDKHQQTAGTVKFNLAVTVSESDITKTVMGGQGKTVQFTLQSTNNNSDEVQEPSTQVETHALGKNQEFEPWELLLVGG